MLPQSRFLQRPGPKADIQAARERQEEIIYAKSDGRGTGNIYTISQPFTTTGGMGEECMRYHNRLAELVAEKKGEDYATTVSWIRSKVSFAILRSALLCLRGSRTAKKQLEVMFQKRTLNWIDSLPKSRSYIVIIFYVFNAFHIGIATFIEQIEFVSVFFCSPVL